MVEPEGRRKDTWVKAVRNYVAAKAALQRRAALATGPAMPPIPPEMPPDRPVDVPPVVDDPPGVPPPAPAHDPPSMPPSPNAKVIKALAKRLR